MPSDVGFGHSLALAKAERTEMKKWGIAFLGLVLFVAWYAFRPERFFIDQSAHEELPRTEDGSAPKTLALGIFHGVMHPTEGTATVYSLGHGNRILRFTGFRTTNGPNVHVYMLAASDAKDNASARNASFIDLGSIKGNVGDQNYSLGPEADLSRYRTVLLWCKRFSVNFGAAPLTSEDATRQQPKIPHGAAMAQMGR
jgi:hypothetical protein